MKTIPTITKPLLGDFIFPIPSIFRPCCDNQWELRGFSMCSKIIVEFLSCLRKLETPDDLTQNIVEYIAHKAAISPMNKPERFTVADWENNFSVRRNFWIREFNQINDAILHCARSTYEFELHRYNRLQELLDIEDLNFDAKDLLVYSYQKGLL